MSSTFGGITNALSALNAQRYGLDITSQNMANANTPGYTRQRAELAAVGPVAGVPSLYVTGSSASGVTSLGATRMSDPILDARVRTEHGRNGQAQTAATALSNVESLFDEPSKNGLAEQLGNFWNSWSSLAANPGDDQNGLAARTAVLKAGSSVAASLNTLSAGLATQTTAVSDQLNADVTDLNNTAASLAKINASIAIATATGSPTNALADQRDQLLMTLADKGGVKVSIGGDGQAAVTLGTQNLVTGNTAGTVAVGSGYSLTVNGTATGTVGGSVQGSINALVTDIPSFQSQLDAVASALSSTVNSAMASGYDLSGAAGTPFFSGSTASGISVAITDPKKIAASGTAGGNYDGSNADQVADFSQLAGGADSVYGSLISNLGTTVATASQQATVQDVVTTNADNQRDAIGGVSIDEEATSLLTYQRAYQAASRVLTTVDETLDTLINRTGRVGL